VTWVGQVLDPIADKLLISATLISLVQLDLAPAWMVAIIIGRELAITGLRSIAYARGLTMPASPLGKLKMVSQVVAILLLILGWERMPLLLLAGKAALWVVLAMALWSAGDYYVRFNRAMSDLSRVADFSAAKARAEERKQRAV
jgi:CDP-diacylglycerol--glycerol-3-phosphate 3-phosphatidyltransferase